MKKVIKIPKPKIKNNRTKLLKKKIKTKTRMIQLNKPQVAQKEKNYLYIYFSQYLFFLIKKIQLESGATYEGEWKNGLRDGYGRQ